jgi:Di- and tripeptidases
MTGNVSHAKLVYLLRDHDADSFHRRQEMMRNITAVLNRKYGAGTVVLTGKEQYRNMEEILRKHPFLIETAEQATRNAGLTPVVRPIRGGTDGAMLSFRGLPCPNLGTGGYNAHGEYEFVSARQMKSVVQILLNIVEAFARKT